MEIIKAKTADLIPYGFNNRVHSDQQVDRIANSINQFGFNQPIVVDENNIILVGHGRFEAAKKLNLEEVPVVKKTNLTETGKKAYRILDNKLQNDSTWNVESLEIELAALEEADFDFDAFGLHDLISLVGSSDGFHPALDPEAVSPQTFESKYGVMVICKSEAQQEQIFEELQTKGYECRVVVS